MASKKRKYRQKIEFDPYDDLDFSDDYADDVDIKDISRDFYSTYSDYEMDEDSRITARRQIERRRDMKKLYSELDDWEEIGSSDDWS
jgi:hypothetical protein